MRALISFIITFIASMLHFQFQLTQSVSLEENNGLLVQSCTQASFLKEYLYNILRSPIDMQYQGNIFILTDCISNFYIQEFELMSNISLAVANITILDQVNSRIFHEIKPFIVLNLPETLIEYATKQIYKAYQLILDERVVKWEPTISVIWKSAKQADEQYALLQNVFNTTILHFNTMLFVYFLEPSSVWELYSIKMKRFHFSVTSFPKEELCKGASTSTFNLLSLLENLQSYARRRRNFRLERLTVSVKFDANYRDWVGISISEEKMYALTSGYVAVLYWDLKLLMNFSEHILLGDSPRAFPNGTLGGITVQQLRSGEIDLTLNQISFSQQRAKELTFLLPTYYSLTHVFFKQPSTNSIRDIVITAFQKELWITLIGVWAILVISTKVRSILLYKNTNFLWLDISARGGDDKKFSDESGLWSVAAFCQKTWYLDPSCISLRMKFMIGSLVGFLTYTAYSGSIVSSLTVNKTPVKSFVDLIDFNFIFTVHEYSEPFQTLLKGMIKSYALTQGVRTISTTIEVSHLFSGSHSTSVKSTKTAFLSPADMFYKTAELLNYSNTFICDHISSFTTSTYPTKSAMLVKKNSQFKEVLNYMLIYLQQRGLIHRNIEHYNTKNFMKCIPKDEQDSKVEPATWIDVYTIFLILFIGFLSAILLLLLENAYICYCDWKSRLRYHNIVLEDMRNYCRDEHNWYYMT